MQHSPIIQHLNHQQINQQQWDDCVQQAPNGLIYAHSFYLNQVCNNWSAFIGEDYSWVMPLTAKSKYGISYLYQPHFTQQTGVFVKNKNVTVPWNAIITLLKKKYKFWEVNFNYATPLHPFGSEFKVATATNFILPLQHDYAAIYNNFHKDHQRNIRRSQKFRLVYRPLKNYLLAIEQYIQHYGHRMKHVTTSDYNRFKNIAAFAAESDRLICREVVNQQNELMATALLFTDGNRLYNMMNTTNLQGRSVEANHFLLNAIIKEFAGTETTFDFEGSDLTGVNEFYKKFGAINQPYFSVKYNKLPWPINLLKR